MRERRLGSLLRHERWDYAGLFGITLGLAGLSAFFRMLWVFFIVNSVGALDDFWISGSRGSPPTIAVVVFVIGAASLATGAALLEPRNRSRAGWTLATLNLGFVALLALAAVLLGEFAGAVAQHHASAARSSENLARELAGRWQVAQREDPPEATAFPVDGFTLNVVGGAVRVQLHGMRPDVLEVWGRIEAVDNFAPRTRLASLLGPWLGMGSPRPLLVPHGPAVRITGADYTLPAIVLEAVVRPRIEDLPTTGECAWIAELRDRDPQMLTFRLVRGVRRDESPTRVALARVVRPAAGWDVAEELTAPVADWW